MVLNLLLFIFDLERNVVQRLILVILVLLVLPLLLALVVLLLQVVVASTAGSNCTAL